MSFLADLHIHSRFSRATSKALNAAHLAAWGVCKGLHVIGTGDFTHPVWREELREQLVLDESIGLYRLKGAPEHLALLGERPVAPERSPLFVLQTEISSIYKRHGKVRKVHNLVFVPTLEDAERLSAALSKIGNLNADGRPILGLDSHDLLELVLETVPGGVLIPAHIWTPWFSLFGSRSGFDSMEECFADLSEHVFALETGLSSDPAMNRLVSQLDKYVLISNSDAHSGANLAREANVFEGTPSYEGIFTALRTAAKREDQTTLPCRFGGTLEFFPEEGKYHLDGHRNCGVCLSPEESVRLNDICPVCGKPLTVGVLHRVMALADRSAQPQLHNEPDVRSLIPLPEIIGELLGAGPGSQKVQLRYANLLQELGSELDILCELPLRDLGHKWDELGEAVARLRRGDVIRNGGFDGQFGVIRLFAESELPDKRQRLLTPKKTGKTTQPRSDKLKKASIESLPLFVAAMQEHAAPTPRDSAREVAHDTSTDNGGNHKSSVSVAPSSGIVYSDEQAKALADGPHPVLVLAGPGAGKTRTLIGRLVHLLEQGVSSADILAVTFTQRAAREMRERLAEALPKAATLPDCLTLHAYAYQQLRKEYPAAVLLQDDLAEQLFAQANPDIRKGALRKAFAAIQLAEERFECIADSELAQYRQNYNVLKLHFGSRPCLDFCDLLLWLKSHLAANLALLQHLLVDEIQDLTPLQLSIVRALLPEDGRGFFGIGDPDQSIYAFRGALGIEPETLREHWPSLAVHRLRQSYRAAQPVLDMSHQLLGAVSHCGHLEAHNSLETELHLFAAPTAQAEHTWMVKRMGALLGAGSHTLLDSKKGDMGHASVLDNQLTPGDIAVLVRLKAQLPPIAEALSKAGIPVQTPQTQLFWQDDGCARLLHLCAAAVGLPAVQIISDAFASDPASHTPLDALPFAWRDGLPSPQEMTVWLSEQPWAGPLFCKADAFAALCKCWNEQGNWADFFATLALLQETDTLQRKAEAVQLLTLHAAKGLEFKAIFLPGLEDGLMPLNRALLFGHNSEDSENVVDVAEERRLLYVGLTRASQGIFASYANTRHLYGRELSLAPSPFLPQIRDFYRKSTLVRRAHKSMTQGSLF